ncbi:MAG: hypothetical protein HC834_05590 [Rhodospirillales bacterium]|nr:hypothetical protein [Rhodospirillales bacterium]
MRYGHCSLLYTVAKHAHQSALTGPELCGWPALWFKLRHLSLPFDLVAPVRLINVAESAAKLRTEGFIVSAKQGAIVIDDEADLVRHIESFIDDVGGDIVARVIFNALYFEPRFGRYRLIRNVGMGHGQRSPTVPIGYVLNLAARSMGQNTEAPFNASESDILQKIRRMLELATWYVATKDVEPYSYLERMLFRPSEIFTLLHQIITYDEVFLFPQMAPKHVLEVIGGAFVEFSDEECRRSWGGTPSEVAHVCRQILDIATNTRGPYIFPRPKPDDTPMCADVIARFIHVGRPNREYRYPSNYPDLLERPLLDRKNEELMIPDVHWCGPAFYEAMAQSLRDSHVEHVDTRIGPGVEHMIHQALRRRGIRFASGEYQNSYLARTLECDCVIETEQMILIVEIKKRSLAPSSRRGNDMSLLFDLCAGLLKSQVQALRHEIQFRREGRIEFVDGTVVNAGNRDYENISITLTEYGTLHDRESAQQFLRTALTCDFGVPDSVASSPMVKEIEDLQRKLRDCVGELARLEAPQPDVFFTSAFLSVPQVLILLDDVKDANGLASAFLSTRHTSTGTGDFLFDYAFDQEIRGA